MVNLGTWDDSYALSLAIAQNSCLYKKKNWLCSKLIFCCERQKCIFFKYTMILVHNNIF